jgi:predicted transposase YbfD/YdcC
VVRSQRTIKKTGISSTESRYYLSSAEPQQYSRSEWLQLIRGHWAGAEIRNHWRRDVLMGEDRSRSRNPNLLANLAIIRSALLCVLADQLDGQSPSRNPRVIAFGPRALRQAHQRVMTSKQKTLQRGV